ncbi:MAG TPA: molybdopterin cofactor-binding domain-containing protein, partial [Chloroflexota bacterium]|nr:molybdopterin cofactor-binding domain-containing protein [Chloroflexota bacterium]
RALDRFGYQQAPVHQPSAVSRQPSADSPSPDSRLPNPHSRLTPDSRLRRGIGIAFAAEPSTSNSSSYIVTSGKQTTSGVGDAARVRIGGDGTVRVMLGNSPSGQGYETATAQIVADELGVDVNDVYVVTGFDSFESPWMQHSGNFSNKFAGTDTGAIIGACKKVKAKIDAIAAHLEATLGKQPTLREIAAVAYRDLLRLPPGLEPGLDESCYYSHPIANLPDEQRRWRGQLVTTNACHICEVEVDLETGDVKVPRYLVVHDCGTEINPLIIEGQVHGATLHGIATALMEEFRYDEQGQLLTASFMDYLKPTSAEAPFIDSDHLETPSPFTPLGSKGVGEGGAVPAPACIANAVEDALWDLGVRLNELPLTPDRIWEKLQGTQAPSPSRRGLG